MQGENQADGVPQPTDTPVVARADRSVWSLVWNALALSAVFVGVMAATSALRWLQAPEVPAADEPVPSVAVKPTPRLFRDWPAQAPDVALLLSGQMHGYIQPCGCSKPQLGGLERRYAFLKELRERGWPVLPVDLGDVGQHPSPQSLLKYRVTMQALKLMGYTAVGIGQSETEMPLLTALAHFAVENKSPSVLAANLRNKDTNFASLIQSTEFVTVGPTNVKVGIVATVGPSAAKLVRDDDVVFSPNGEALKQALDALAPRSPDLYVLLYQGTQEEAKAAADRFPQFGVILCQSREEEPSGVPAVVHTSVGTQTLVIGVGHKGRYVGVVGCYATGVKQRPFDFRYQLVSLHDEYEVPAGHEADNPVLGLLEKYTDEVKRDNYLARYPQRAHPVQIDFPEATYVGSAACTKCHPGAAKVWAASRHAHAFSSLQKAVRPANRQFDGECVACHVVGFGYTGGFRNEHDTAKLENVGCESCHGPGSLHAKGDKSPQLLALMNPFKTAARDGDKPDVTAARKKKVLDLLDQACQKCHDHDNDVHWDFDKKWPLVEHTGLD